MRREYKYYVYIATNKSNKVLYTGITNNIQRRENEHRNKINKNSFTSKYNINKVVFYELYGDVYRAIEREKQIKKGSRQRKLDLIKEMNPSWRNLTRDFYEL